MFEQDDYILRNCFFRFGRGSLKAVQHVNHRLSLESEVLVPWRTKLYDSLGHSTRPGRGANGLSFEDSGYKKKRLPAVHDDEA